MKIKQKITKSKLNKLLYASLTAAAITPLVTYTIIYLVETTKPKIFSISNELNKFNETSEYFTYLSQRTTTLRFIHEDSKNNKSWYYSEGTAWVFYSKNNFLYLATNLHVANALLFQNKSISFPYDKNSYYTNNYGNLLEVDLGYINETNKGNNFEDNNNQIKYLKISQKPEIIYSSFLDKDFSTTYGTGYYSGLGLTSLSETKYPPTIDFAIIKVDVTSITEPNPVFVNGTNFVGSKVDFNNWLKTYNSNPTKFYKNTFNPNDQSINDDFKKQNLHIGGFSTTSEISYFDEINYTKKPLVSWTALSNINFESFHESLEPFIYMQKPKDFPLIIPVNNYANSNDNSYYYGFADVGVTGLISDNLFSGASGSMVINDNFELVGIYWGSSTYISDDNQNIISRGGIEFLNVSNYVGKDKINYFGYNFIDNAINLISKDV